MPGSGCASGAPRRSRAPASPPGRAMPNSTVRLRKKVLLPRPPSASTCGGRAGREDHHRAEGEQAEGRGEQHRVLRRPADLRGLLLRGRPADLSRGCCAGAQSASTAARKASPRCSKSLKASKLAQAGERRTTSPGCAADAAARTAASEAVAAVQRHTRVTEGGGDLLRRLADQIAGGATLANRIGEAARMTLPSACRRGSRARRRRRTRSAAAAALTLVALESL